MKLKINCIIGQIKTGRFEDTINYFDNLNNNQTSYFGYSSPFSDNLHVIYSIDNKYQNKINLNFLKIFRIFKTLSIFIFFFLVLIIFFLKFNISNKKIFAISAFGSFICIIKKKLYFYKNIIIYYYCLDYYPFNNKKNFYDKVFSKVFRLIDLFNCNNCDGIFDITKRISEIRNKLCSTSFKPYELNLGYHASILDFKIKCKKENKLIFFGTHSENQNIDLILKIFEYLNDISYYELIVCGHGPETKNFQTKFYKSKYSSNIKFYGYVENKKLFKLIQLSRFSFGLWKDDKDDNSQFADPGKVKLSILLGTPCILSNHLYSFEIFKDECGPVIFNGSLDTFNFSQSFFNEKIYKNYLNNCEKYINECLLNYHLDPFAKPSN